MKILIVLTSQDKLGDTGEETGFWLEEFAAPYYVFKDNGAAIDIASPAGGEPPVDPRSKTHDAQTDDTRRLDNDDDAQALLENTMRIKDVIPELYDAVFYPGGHGPMWDLYEDPDSIALIEKMNADAKPIGVVCHAPSALLKVKNANGALFIKDRHVTGFSNEEEEAVGLSDAVPYLLEDELKKSGAIYSRKDNWEPYSLVDGNLVTGQNPASSKPAAQDIIKLLEAETTMLQK